ncbi:MAG: cob(I)yrinic acid a,c-diamide adenosyltransferase [Deltaproteobacteria bacterium]|nr:MAG: cob(I)yrinic acid a,c-diamide adenosyltransferase [Deltaproteobacteria bacterium]
MPGMVQVYTGNGKGKTTAALGLAMRAIGQGFKVHMIQFMKGNIDYGELKTARRLAPDFTITQMGRETFVDRDNPDEVDREWARKGMRLARELLGRDDLDVLILDEINVAVDFQLVTKEEVLSLIRQKPADLELVLTGRYAPVEIVKEADLVTEMLEIKHYYHRGIESRRGFEL